MRSPIAALVALAVAAATQSPAARAQATAPSTASQQLALSAFGGGTGTFTDLLGGKNLGITAGADLAFLTYRRFRPVLEVRGTYPVYNGQVDAQKSFLGGLKVERQFGPVHPYVDFLVGRGEIDYQHGGLAVGTLLFLSSTSTVFSPGLGLDYDVTPQWAIKADFQYQHWDTPFATSAGNPVPVVVVTNGGVFQVGATGVINPRVLTLGAVYRFDFNPHYRRPRHER